MSAMDSFEEYRDAARRSGVPEHAVDTGLRLARPQIGLGPADGGGGVLAGRYGGRPVLPPDVDWNGFPDLIASVDCAALPRGVLDFPLPQDGHLLFFANRRDPEGSAGDGAVVHVPSGAAAVERVPDEGAPHTDPYPLYARTAWSMPTGADGAVVADGETERVYREHRLDQYDGLEHVRRSDLILGGYAYSPQDPPFVQTPADYERDGGERVLLAQASYEIFGAPGWTGYAVWVMYRHDLEAMDFTKAMGGVLGSHP
ncbi:DUF1963 domain-containing protein [Nocardiopsis dassonvillei]|uniref:DUF1963 domain-containing protein n=1 Tax=Nocardiopsis dassonvillei TaxID=2014 RepID=UPI003671107A